jgi:general secretion pathway protein G
MFGRSHPTRDRHARGFTLLEMVTVLGMVGVLVAIALPSYTKHRDRLRTNQAVIDITGLASQIEQHSRETRDLPGSLGEIGAAGRLDPWGRPYVYYNVELNGRGHARKDHALNPINSDFDLYSLGPDGQTKPQVSHRLSADDIIRAGNGRFLGIAAEF